MSAFDFLLWRVVKTTKLKADAEFAKKFPAAAKRMRSSPKKKKRK